LESSESLTTSSSGGNIQKKNSLILDQIRGKRKGITSVENKHGNKTNAVIKRHETATNNDCDGLRHKDENNRETELATDIATNKNQFIDSIPRILARQRQNRQQILDGAKPNSSGTSSSFGLQTQGSEQSAPQILDRKEDPKGNNEPLLPSSSPSTESSGLQSQLDDSSFQRQKSDAPQKGDDQVSTQSTSHGETAGDAHRAMQPQSYGGLSILSLPRHGTYLTPVEGDDFASQSKLQLDPQKGTNNDTTTEDHQHHNLSRTDDSEEDPITDLSFWKAIASDGANQRDKMGAPNGSSSTFRHALASMIITKNQSTTKQTNGSNGGGLLWLPPILAGKNFDLKSLR
jgi:hypothetical protein